MSLLGRALYGCCCCGRWFTCDWFSDERKSILRTDGGSLSQIVIAAQPSQTTAGDDIFCRKLTGHRRLGSLDRPAAVEAVGARMDWERWGFCNFDGRSGNNVVKSQACETGERKRGGGIKY